MTNKKVKAPLWPALLLSLCLTACVQISEHLTIRPDGSGTLVMQVRSNASNGEICNMMGLNCAKPRDERQYPPATLADVEKLFASESFTIKELPPSSEKSTNNNIHVEIGFAHIDDLLQSAYARARSLEVIRADGRLTVRSRSGLAPLALCSGLAKGNDDDYLNTMLTELCREADKARITYTVTFPEKPRSDKGQVKNRDVTWQLTAPGASGASAGTLPVTAQMSATCPDDGLAFDPAAQVRLDMHNFADIAEDQVVTQARIPEHAQYADALTFTPVELKLIRSFAISELSRHENMARLIGFFSVPAELAPDEWGGLTLTEVTDDRGNNLILSKNARERYYGNNAVEELRTRPQESPVAGVKRHPVGIDFKPPPLACRAIARLNGTIDLIHFANRQTIKVAKGLDPMPPRKQSPEEYGDNWTRIQQLVQHPWLMANGTELKLEQSLGIGTARALIISIKSERATMDEIRFYDDRGEPLPVLYLPGFIRQFSEEAKQDIVVIFGANSKPLSLAAQLRSGSAPMAVPFAIADLSLQKTDRTK